MTENGKRLETPVEQTDTARTVRKSLTLFGSDADLWEADGMPREEIDALVLALWRWYRGRPETVGLTVAAKVLYTTITKRLEATEDEAAVKAACGRKGGKKTQARNRFAQAAAQAGAQAVAQARALAGLLKPTPTPTATPTASSTTTTTPVSDTHIHRGDTPQPPVCVGDLVCCLGEKAHAPKRGPFVKPAVEDVRAYCQERGFAEISAEDFVDYYESNGWVVGNAPMKDWRRTVDRWHRKNLRGKAAERVSEETSYVQPGYVLRLGAEDEIMSAAQTN